MQCQWTREWWKDLKALRYTSVHKQQAAIKVSRESARNRVSPGYWSPSKIKLETVCKKPCIFHYLIQPITSYWETLLGDKFH